MDLKQLIETNNRINIKDIQDKAFTRYGEIIDDYDFNELTKYMEEKTQIPSEGNIYIASVSEMENTKIREELENEFYGEIPIEIGYCNGSNSTLNGLEYHKGSEINVAVTDMVLLLGQLKDVNNNKYDSSKVEAFFVKKSTAIQLYETTLHFGPCKTSKDGFKCIVILIKGTNEPLREATLKHNRDILLFAKNKWLLAHPERKLLIEKGAYAGIIGENIEIRFQND
ncbi:DUF4867 family protein [Clostridium pasteurianum]|uniref:DUF4867 domain-containing protein n=1 Tax=Clostridium pasteurianum BC1 TaxID=86416 RepID=R4K619_CLOPA|nr:DUF4867 family protein [Clostridium pasteurianum]AGK95969.1 hypothetical protein Clopa_0953 [Clostridium pasteurianum BC1]